VTEFALFGSVVRPEEFRDDSDVDVLVKFGPDAELSFSGWLDMRDELMEIFGREVDLAERAGVEQMRNYLRRAAILETAVFLDVA
jgi:predicted nucleotidyltransferase